MERVCVCVCVYGISLCLTESDVVCMYFSFVPRGLRNLILLFHVFVAANVDIVGADGKVSVCVMCE